jgi:endonuclease G
MYANESGRKPLSTYVMSVEDMQTITDIDFFPSLPDDIEREMESRVDFTQWNIKSNK